MGCKEIMVVEGSEYLPIHLGALSELMFSCGPEGWGSWGKSCKIMEKKFIVILLEGDLFFTCQNFEDMRIRRDIL